MRILLPSLLLILYASIGFADQSSVESAACSQQLSSEIFDNQLAQRGCCSHHGGVCGCSGGRAQCCDGALSPSCGCNKEDAKEIKNLEVNRPES